MKGPFISIVFLFLFLVPAEAFRAGAAKRDITPPLKRPVFIAGFGNNRTALGVHDPIWVRCLVLSDNQKTVAFVGVDFIGYFYEPDVVAVRQRVRRRLKLPVTVLIASTHNHEGPDTLGIWGPTPFQTGLDPAYLRFVREQITEAIIEAVHALEPAHLIIAQNDDPRLAELQFDTRPPYVKNHTLRVLCAVREGTGKVIGTLVNWANHPETLGSKNRLISADFPWALYDALDKELGGVTVYWTGAIGGLITTLDETVKVIDPVTGEPAPEESFRKTELIGRFLAESAMRAIRSTKAIRLKRGKISLRLRPIFVPLQNIRFRVAAGLGVLQRPIYTDGRLDRRVTVREVSLPGGKRVKAKVVSGKDIRTEVGVVALYGTGKEPIALFLLIPGEIYPELVYGGITRYPGADFPDAPMEPILMDVARRTKAKVIFVVGLANDEIGYIIPQCEWDDRPPWLNNAPKETYGEVNSVGWKAARRINEALITLLQEFIRGENKCCSHWGEE